MRQEIESLAERLKAVARVPDAAEAREQLEGLRSEDIAEACQRLSLEEGLEVIMRLDDVTAADVLTELPTELARQYIGELPDATIAHYIDILPMDDAIELREELGEERFDAILEIIPEEDARELRRLLAYPEDTVGRNMTESFFDVNPEMTMEQILTDIRMSPEGKYEMVNDLYVLSQDRHLLGVISLRRVIRAQPGVTAREIMNPDVVTCEDRQPVEEAARTMSRYGFYALPVVDGRSRMVGIFTGDDAQEVLREAETEDQLKMGAVSGNAGAYPSLGVFQLVKRRVPWLFALFVAESLTGNVLRAYGQSTTDLRMNPLAFFIPLLIGAGGNSGSQVSTTITRALALGEIRPADWWRVTRREFVTACVSGTLLGAAGFLRAWLPIPIIGWNSGLDISLVVGLTLPAIVIWSTSLGSLLPITAKRIGIDPAVMCAPFIATFVDATGLVIYFEIARRMLHFI